MPRPAQSNRSAFAWLKARAAANSKTLASFASLLVVWELAVRLLGVKLYILPPPSVVIATLWAKSSTIGMAAWYTAQPMLIGYALAIVVGVLLALSFAASRLIESIVYPQIVFLQIIPKIAIAPLFMIWFGYGLTSKVLVVFLLSFFPVVVSAVQGFRSLDPDIRDLARITGAGAWRMFWKVQVPHALPDPLHRLQGCGCAGGHGCRRRRIRLVRSGPRLSAGRLHEQVRYTGCVRGNPRAQFHGSAALCRRRGAGAPADPLARIAPHRRDRDRGCRLTLTLIK